MHGDELQEEGETGVGEFVLRDAPPIAIAQPASSKRPPEVNEGQFYAPQSGEALGEKLLMVPVAIFDTRAYWPKEGDPNFDADRKIPCCASNDGLLPRTGESPEHADHFVADSCAACSFGRWRSDPHDKKKRIAPLCSKQINVFGVFYGKDGSSRIGTIGFKVTSYRAAEAFVRSLDAQFPPRPEYQTVAELSLTLVKEDQRRYYYAGIRVVGQTLKQFPDAEASFKKLKAAWPALREALINRAAMGDDEDDAHPLPF